LNGSESEFGLSGDLRSEDLDQVKTEIERCGTSAVLDVEEVALVDLDGVQFLNRCEANGVAVFELSGSISGSGCRGKELAWSREM